MTDTTLHTTHATGAEKLRGHLAMVGFALLIAGSFTLGKLTAPHIGAAPVNAVRFAAAALFMGVIAFGIQRQPMRLPVAPWRYALLSLLMAWYFLSMFIALKVTSPVATAAVFTLTPLVTAVIAFAVLRQRTGPGMATVLAIAAAGAVWVIFRADIGAILGFRVGEGEAIYFTGCVCHALFTVLLRLFGRGEPLAVSTFWIALGNAAWLTLFGAGEIVATDWAHLPAIVWLAVAYLAIFPSAITLALMQYAAHRLPASKVMAYGYLVPVFVLVQQGTLGLGWPTGPVLAGIAVIGLAMIIIQTLPDR
ncbi:MAG: DMT family transporter [Rhodobiaceae bacterium]|nr:DMT family transporter [Rhodobiaceae bacterium]